MNKTIQLTVNGDPRNVSIDTRARLVDLIRDSLGLTGTHLGCGTGNCGACTVLVDQHTVKSCCTLALDVDGAEIMTIEGLANGEQLHPIQHSFAECHGLQCGFCTPGMILSTLHLLGSNPAPTEDEIREAISGNICRCTGYVNIVASILDAAHRMSDTTAQAS